MNTVMPVGPVRNVDQIEEDAKPFIDEYYRSIKKFGSKDHLNRWAEITEELKKTGTYNLTYTELAYGAKTAWRNAYRCIGRIQWNKLQVFDARFVGTAYGMFEQVCGHLRYATNNGNLRSAITIFPHRQRGRHDFRVWNTTMISYACYRQEDGTLLGDRANLELTQAAQRLGWKGKGTHQDVLPLVVQAGDGEAKFFDFPEELVLQVPLSHPDYPWFEEMNFKWFAVPGVSCMKLDMGGLEFSAIPFSGWYMETEIGARDLTDPQRYNITEKVAKKMGLNTATNNSLWQDKACVEINLAVLHSFQKNNVTIMDHHSTCESFMKHMKSEFKQRGGCPGDWVWLVPPISGSLAPVFHQEILSYLIKPMYDYQDQPYKKYDWDAHFKIAAAPKKNRRFKELARAALFASNLFKSSYAKRVKATILYATETGKSLTFANQLADIFSHAFQPEVICMADYDLAKLEYEQIVLAVVSTFGNGDAPENGSKFGSSLQALKQEKGGEDKESKSSDLRALMKNVVVDEATSKVGGTDSRIDPAGEEMQPLSSVRFSVFALGSKAYPNFCSFGKYVDCLLGELGAERVAAMACGDELNAQEQSFKEWAMSTYKACCETFCIQADQLSETALTALHSTELSEKNVQIVKRPKVKDRSFASDLSVALGRQIFELELVSNKDMLPMEEAMVTMLVILTWKSEDEAKIAFQPGDHVGIMPENRHELVRGIMKKLTECPERSAPVEVQILEEIPTIAGPKRVWKKHQKLPVATIEELLSRFLDITTPPTQKLLKDFAERARDEKEKERLTTLAMSYEFCIS